MLDLNLLSASSNIMTWVFVGILVVLVVVLLVAPLVSNKIAAKKNGGAMPNSTGTDGRSNLPSSNGPAPDFIGDNAEYCRWCRDTQPVIERTSEQQRLVDKYFIVRNDVTSNKMLLGACVVAALVGIILAVVYFVNGMKTVALIIAGAILIAAAFILYKLYKNSFHRTPPSDLISHEAYEQAVRDKIKEMNVEQMGLAHLGLDADQVREIKPIVFTDYEVIGTSLRVYEAAKKRVHSSTQTVMLIYFTDEQLFVYKLQFDMCCNKQEEWTSEYFYSDICDIATYINKNVLDLGVGSVEYSTLKVNIVATNSDISFSMENDKDRYASIHAMRQKVRERKMR